MFAKWTAALFSQRNRSRTIQENMDVQRRAGSLCSRYARPIVAAEAGAEISGRGQDSGSAVRCVAAIVVISWAIVLLGVLGLSPLGFGMAAQLVHYGVEVRRGESVALPLRWCATAAMGAVALLVGLTPVVVLVWIGFLALSLFLTLSLGGSRGRSEADEQRCEPLLLPAAFVAHEITPRRTA